MFNLFKNNLVFIIFSFLVTFSVSAENLHQLSFGENGDGTGLGFALSPSNSPSFSYYNSLSGDFKFTSYVDGELETEVIAKSIPAQKQKGSAIVYFNEEPIVFYIDFLGRIASSQKNAAGTWSSSLVDASQNNIGEISATICQDKICLSYYNAASQNLRFASGKGSSWSKEVVDGSSEVGEFNDISLQRNGLPLIAYFDQRAGLPKIAFKQSGGNWLYETVSLFEHSFGAYPKLEVELDGTIHLLSSRLDKDVGEDLGLYYAVKRPGQSWSVVLIREDYVGAKAGFIIEANGLPKVSHRYRKNLDLLREGRLELTTLESSGAWVSEILSPDNPDDLNNQSFYKGTFLEKGAFGESFLAAALEQNQASSLELYSPKDSDGDGISNQREALLGLDPNSSDSDKDGYLDGAEYFNFNTNPKGFNSSITQLDNDKDGIKDAFDLDDDNDGLSDAAEAITQTNPLIADTDGDSISDGEEIVDGSNPLDSSSIKEELATTLCSEWNGFLGGMFNILETVNLSSSALRVNSVLYDISGKAVSSKACEIMPGAQCDILVHDMTGRKENSYGKICLSHIGEKGDVDGRMVYYKPSKDLTNYDFAFSMPFQNGKPGRQFVSYNTFQPSMNPHDVNNLVANWIQLTNLTSKSQKGKLYFYNDQGQISEKKEVTLAPGARQDFAGHEIGKSLYGMIEWRPENEEAEFQLRNVRYLYDNPWGQSSFATAFQLEGSTGFAGKQHLPLSTKSSSAIIELMNPDTSVSEANVKIFSDSGKELGEYNLGLAPRSSFHLVTDLVLGADEIGSATITVKQNSQRVIATSMHYERKGSGGSISSMYGVSGKPARGQVLQGSYNTFLGQDSNLVIVNGSEHYNEAYLSLIRSDGTYVLQGEPVYIPGNGSIKVSVNDYESANNYGVLTLHSSASNSLTAWVLREKDGSYIMPTEVRD